MSMEGSLTIRWDEHKIVKGKRRKPTVQLNEANLSSGPQSIPSVTPRLFSHLKTTHGIAALVSILFGQLASGGLTWTLVPHASTHPK